jgi:hypothetical protein
MSEIRRKQMKVSKLSKIALAVALAVPAIASAESNVVTAGSANARLDFQITIPRILFLQVGTGTLLADNTAVSLMSATVPAANLGDSTPVAFGPATIPVRVIGNNGQVTIAATTTGALSNGTDSISFTKIAGSSDSANLPHPGAFVDGGTSATVNVALTGTKLTNQSANWSFTYANDAVVPAGTYGGANTNNSRVTYTAAMP